MVADTHLRRGARDLPGALLDAITGADLVIHAGDVTSREALRQLGAMADTRAVLGNNDRELAGILPVALEIELDGVLVGVVHDGGPAARRAGRLARRFPEAAVVVFGHSHVPLVAPGVAGQLLFNPGSPTQRRLQPFPTFGRLCIERGRVLHHAIEPLPLSVRLRTRRAPAG